MSIQIGFYGAAETVTGSKYLLSVGQTRLLIDCGLFQGMKDLRALNWRPPGFDPKTLGGIALTHAHLDHTGYLPRLAKDGYSGSIFCTHATAELTELILLDSAFNQERDAEYANRKGFSKHHPALPLYTSGDARQAVKQLRRVQRGEWFSPAEPIYLRYHDAGHLLGSCMIEAEIRQGEKPLRVLFSGDVGRYDAPLYFDPAPPPACDYLVCESTYGNREHAPGPPLDQLDHVVNEAISRGGVILMASFAIGRAQQLTYLLQLLMHQQRIPSLPIFIDSPMAIDATHIYHHYRAEHDLAEGELLGRHSVLRDENVHLARTVEQSKRLNHIERPAVIISSSGMMEGGRILHHLKRRLPDAKNTILLGGFMAAGTRGRTLQEGAKWLRIHGQDVPVRAAIASVAELSGHAGRSELLRWLKDLPAPREVFLTHGEKACAMELAETLRQTHNWKATVPALGQIADLSEY